MRFRRCKAMLALPEPQPGTIDDLRRFVNVGDDDWPLMLSCGTAAMRPRGPYPILELQGEQGSAKSTVARVWRELVDPNAAPLRCEPREPRDLMIAANNGWMVALDNLSRLPPWLSDALCRLSTGGGFSTRTLYENDEETIFDAQRPVILTGIEEVATRSDLLDRSVAINLPRIPESRRQPEAKFWREFQRAKPKLLGAMLTVVSGALQEFPNIHLQRLPRMADFALWGVAVERSAEFKPGTFLSAYAGNRRAGHELAIESSLVGKAVLDFVEKKAFWHGSATDLLNKLGEWVDDKTLKAHGWPQQGSALSGVLKRLAPNLRALGVDVEIGRESGGRRQRFIELKRKQGEKIVPKRPERPVLRRKGRG